MGAELGQAVLVDVLNPVCLIRIPSPILKAHKDIHARGTPGDFASLFHAVQLASAISLSLAHHVVVIVGFASRTDEVGGTEKRR